MNKRRSGWRRLKASAQNALELARLGRIGSAASEAYEVVDSTLMFKLRRYGGARRSAPLLLIPPLMLTAEIYDVAPDLSAVGLLVAAGIDCWVVDFGAPERQSGGMERTLDDHVRAVAEALRHARAISGRDVHLAGYSQGGMFAYQVAALVRSAGIASLVTFGAPVDIHRNLPSVAGDVASRMIRAARPFVDVPLRHVQGLPGQLSSAGFRLLTPRKEAQQLVDFVRKLHDRSALEKRESRRRFLRGEGFVAWPGPALQRFFDDIIVANRMVQGGLVIDGHTVTLADIRCPILYFVGRRDDFARPPSVRAITRAAPEAPAHEIELVAGHFGLVVGTTALTRTWPSVVEWVRWRDGEGPIPAGLQKPIEERSTLVDEPEEGFEPSVDYELVSDEIASMARNAWKRLGDVYRDASDTVHDLRHQLPRLRQLERLTGDTRISASLALAEQARASPDRTFFLWRGRAFSFRDADTRVDAVTRGFIHCGIRRGDRVAVLMGMRPSFLSAVTALCRMGAVAMLLSPRMSDAALAAACTTEPLRAIVVDIAHAARARDLCSTMLLLGSGARDRAAGAMDMETIDPSQVDLPPWYRPDAGRARDLGLLIAAPGRGDEPKVSRITHGRWAFSALGVASAATLTPADTVYSCLPLHHPTGFMVAVGGAMVSGARLALSEGFEPQRFWPEVRRYGATVAFYAGEMLRPLVLAPPVAGEQNHPLRLFAGSGLRAGLWTALIERFGAGVLELYAATERNLVLANASGEKVGSIGRPLPGSAELCIARCDLVTGNLVERKGHLLRCHPGEPGLALVRVPDHVESPRLRRDAFLPGDRWLVSDDVLAVDADGDHWYVDRSSNMVRSAHGAIATPRVEDALYRLPEIESAVVVSEESAAGDVPVAYVTSRAALDPERLTRSVLDAGLAPHERPRRIARMPAIPLTEGFRPMKAWLRDAEAPAPLEVVTYDERDQRYS